MIIAKIKVKIRVIERKRVNIEQIDIENLKDMTVRRKFQLELSNRFRGLEIDQNLDESWDKVKNIV